MEARPWAGSPGVNLSHSVLIVPHGAGPLSYKINFELDGNI